MRQLGSNLEPALETHINRTAGAEPERFSHRLSTRTEFCQAHTYGSALQMPFERLGLSRELWAL